MRFTTWFLSITLACSITVSARKNPYMTEGTEEYKSVTSKVIGSWDVSSYIRDDRGEQVGPIYRGGTVEFKEPERAGRRGQVVFEFMLNDSIVKYRVNKFREDNPSFEVDKYSVVFTGAWDVYKKEPDLIRFSMNDEMELEITGSADEIEDFKDGEEGALFGMKAMGAMGGIGGFVAQKATESATGTNDMKAEIPYQIKFLVEGDQMDAKGKGDLDFKLTRK